MATIDVRPHEIRQRDRLHFAPRRTALVTQHVVATDDGVYVSLDDVYWPVVLRRWEIVTVDRTCSNCEGIDPASCPVCAGAVDLADAAIEKES